MACDATARLYDVDEDSVVFKKLDKTTKYDQGTVTFRARTAPELKKALAAARRQKKTCLIYVPVSVGKSLPGFSWWDVPVSAVSANSDTQEVRKQYEQARSKQRFYY